jgi:hypothetical protein
MGLFFPVEFITGEIPSQVLVDFFLGIEVEGPKTACVHVDLPDRSRGSAYLL